MTVIEYLKLAAWIAGSVAALFAATHAAAKSDFQKSLGRQLSSLDLAAWIQQFPSTFIDTFDELFGEKYVSVRFISRSMVASLCSLVVVFIAFQILIDHPLTAYIKTWPTADAALWALLLLAIGNLIPDCISLMETRWLLGKLGATPSFYRFVVVIGVDIVFTFLIFWVCFSGVKFVSLALTHDRWTLDFIALNFTGTFSNLFSWITNPRLDIFDSRTVEDPVQLITTFFTSAWLWLYGVSLAIHYIGRKWITRPWALLTNLLDLENKPLIALGWIASAIVLCVFALAMPIVFVLQ